MIKKRGRKKNNTPENTHYREREEDFYCSVQRLKLQEVSQDVTKLQEAEEEDIFLRLLKLASNHTDTHFLFLSSPHVVFKMVVSDVFPRCFGTRPSSSKRTKKRDKNIDELLKR